MSPGFLLWHRDAPVAVASSRRVFRAAEVPVLADANALCERLRALHDEADARVGAAADAARAAAYDEGRVAGERAGREALAERLAAVTASAARDRERLRGEVATLAIEVVRKLVGALDGDAVLAGLAATAARDLLPGDVPTLVVHPSRCDAVRERLGRDAPDLACEVRGDAAVDVDACLLDTGHGSVDAALDAQLERLAAAWGATR